MAKKRTRKTAKKKAPANEPAPKTPPAVEAEVTTNAPPAAAGAEGTEPPTLEEQAAAAREARRAKLAERIAQQEAEAGNAPESPPEPPQADPAPQAAPEPAPAAPAAPVSQGGLVQTPVLSGPQTAPLAVPDCRFGRAPRVTANTDHHQRLARIAYVYYSIIEKTLYPEASQAAYAQLPEGERRWWESVVAILLTSSGADGSWMHSRIRGQRGVLPNEDVDYNDLQPLSKARYQCCRDVTRYQIAELVE